MPKLLPTIWFAACSTVFVVLGGLTVDAQFYAPDTEFHDKAQRMFPVEAARIMAWRENLQGRDVADVAYTVSVDTNRNTLWKIRWVDGAGKLLKEFSVQYRESLLMDGPEYYRKVLSQLWSAALSTNSGKLTLKELNDRYWAGADLNGMAREDGIRASYKLTQPKSSIEETNFAPTLAGLLAFNGMPSLCGGLTIDAVSLARGAAWLALSERMLADPSSRADENWAPILFMAGRENAAVRLWQTKKMKPGQSPSTLFAWWDFFLGRPDARAAFEFVCEPGQRRFGMPMMTYYSRVDYLGAIMPHVVYLLYGQDEQTFSRLQNYGGFLAASTTVSGGRLLEGAWPAIFREQWRRILKEFPASPLDYQGYKGKVEKIPAREVGEWLDPEDNSLAGFNDYVPLLQLGYLEGTGKLIPVAAFTARDLLNYGWEMNGLQMGARYYFVLRMWGVSETADVIYRRAVRDVPGQAPFFPSGEQASVFNLQQSLNRLQLVDDLAWRDKAMVQPFSKDLSDRSAARMFHRRCWLRPYEVGWQAWALANAQLCDEQPAFVTRCHADGGVKADTLLLEWFKEWTTKDLDANPPLKQLRSEIAHSLPWPNNLQINSLYQEQYAALDNAPRAQAYERLFWALPEIGLEQDILNNYIDGGAWKSAKRFYLQSRLLLNEDIEFGNFLSPQAWMLGFLEGDEELMKAATEDSHSGSHYAMITWLWQYAAHDQWPQFETQLDEMIERYKLNTQPLGEGGILKSFVPLIPALKDAKDPKHEAALDHFGQTGYGVLLRWILIRHFHLSTPDAIRFLGGRETDALRHVMVLYLERQKEPMLQAFRDYMNETQNKGAGRPIASWLLRQILGPNLTIEETDLRPPNAKSITQAVAEKVSRAR